MTVPPTMHAVLLHGHGGTERLEYRRDVPTPSPGPGEVLIQVGAAGVNNTDINTRIAWYDRSAAPPDLNAETAAPNESQDGGWSGGLSFPRIQGADVCGRIVAVGEHVPADRIGQRVLVDPVLRPSTPDHSSGYGYFGSECDGGFAQFTTVASRNAVPVATDLTDEALAGFPCSYSTAENMLTRAGLAAGETVFVTGASGGVGSALVQLARRRGARVLAAVGSAKQPAVAALGAETLIDRGADPVSVFGADSVDLVADVAGGPLFPRLLDLLVRHGRYVCSGAVAGPQVQLDLRRLYLQDLTLIGATITDPEVFPKLVGYIERGEIRPVVAQTFALADIVAAQQAFLTKQHTGKIVLIPPPL